MADPPRPPPARRRFAPVPIETTFERYRKGGPPPAPAAEPTPSPSPQSSPQSPAPPPMLWTPALDMADKRVVREKHRFAPQLIESSRRSRRAGDIGPATRPTDKTDITPYHNHIYAPKTRKKHRKTQSLARRESCDEETAAHVFEMLAREAEKRMLEDAALAAFPNSRARAGGAEHFAIREGSDDDSTGGSSAGTRSRGHSGTGRPRILRTARRSRRDSFTEDVGWALREMQEHHEQLTKVRAASVASASPYMAPLQAGQAASAAAAAADGDGDGDGDGGALADAARPRPIAHAVDRVSTIDLDRMTMESPPSDPIWTTTARQATHSSGIEPIGESFMPFIPEEPLALPGLGVGYKGIPSYARQLREAEGDAVDDDGNDDGGGDDLLRQSAPPAVQPIGETAMPYIPSAPEGKAVGGGGGIPAESGFRGRNAYAGYRNRDLFASERDVNRLRKKSPPMLGKELVFPKCQSPKQTKMEPEFLWSMNNCVEKSRAGDRGAHGSANGDGGGSGGGGGGGGKASAGLWHGLCFAGDTHQAVVPIDRPAFLATPYPPSSPGDPFAHAFAQSDPGSGGHGEPRPDDRGALAANGGLPHALAKGGEPKGLRMLAGLDERLRQEKAAAELEEKIAAEFTDRFVTQVYNYLSLGYPAMARSYDDELSKISRISVQDLEQDDAGDGRPSAKGHISLDDDDAKAKRDLASYNHDSCPRWRALKLYIYEWARQHPDLDDVSPLAWGVRERRGSWGV